MKRAVLFVAVLSTLIASYSLLVRASLPHVPSNAWSVTGDMALGRAGASAVLLPDGRVLVTGGTNEGGVTASVERYSPTAGGFLATPSMENARANHTATMLEDGRVLVVGGIGTDGHAMASAELYDPSANAWTAAAPLYHARSGHSATRLWDGRVLVAGGDDTGVADATLEVFDPISSTFSAVDAVLSAARTGHAAASLSDGRVLIVGGFDGTSALASVDVYDPRTNTVSAGPSLAIGRAGHSATTLVDGRVLIAGGASDSSELASAEIFDPSTESFTAAANAMSVARQRHVAFLLPHNNNVLIVGGTAGGNAVATAELFTPWEGTGGTFCATAVCESGFAGPTAPNAARAWAAGAALSLPADHTIRTGPADGLLVLAGGSATAAASNPLSSAELYGFATVKTDKADYAPGNTVAITGSGWIPGESVTLLLREWPEFDEHSLVDVTADENGDIVSTEFVPDAHDIGVRFYLTAFGQVSQAQTTFTDAGVNVTPATGGTNISADKAANATSPQFTQLGDIVLAESAVGDFVIQSNRTFVLTAPSGWEFNPGVGSTSTTKSGPGGNELTANSIAISATTITVNLTVTGTAQTNTLSIKNLEVRATNGANIPASGNILRTVGTPGTAIINGVTNDVTNFGSLSQTAGAVRKLVVTLPNQTFTDGSTIAGSGNSGTPSNQTAGVAFNISRLTATDQFFNVVTTYSGAKTLSYTGPTGSPSFTTAVIFASGQATTALATTLTKAETTTITASDGATSGPASSSLTVNAGPLSTFSVTATDGSNIGTQTAGTPFNIKVAALDAGGNTVTTFDSGGNKVSITSTGTLSAGSGNTSAFINGVLASHSVTFSNSGNFSITATRNAGGSESGTSNTFTVNPPACTAPSVTTQPTNQTITYGQNATFTAAASGSPTPTVQWQLNSGSGFTNMSGATSTTLTLTQPAASANGNQYRAVFTNSCTPPTATSNAATLTVNKATVTPSVTASNKVYDGTTSATIASRSLGGVIGADDVTLTGGTATFNTPNVGTGKTVTAVGLTLSGTTVGNYQLSSPTAMTSANITAVNLTVSVAAAVSRPYDGTTVAVLDFSSASLAGVIAPDVVTIDHASAVGAFADKNVGTNKSVSVTGVALTGAAAGNYTVSQPTGLTANITAKNLTVSAAAAVSRPYDGTTVAVLNFSTASLVGVIAPDVVTIDHASAVGAFADKNVGTNKPVTVTGVGLSGPGAGNYTVSQPSGLTASITAVNLTATIAASDKDYDGTATATITNCSLAGVVGSEAVSCTTSNAHFASANASSSPQTVTTDAALAGADAGNYTLTTPATTSAKINAKAASVTPNAASKTYGTADPGFSGTLSGFVAADGVTATYSRTAGETVAGPYTISAVLNPAAVLGNYTITYNTASFTIDKALASVTPNAASKTYGTADPGFSGTLSGFVAADGVTAVYSRTAGETVAGPYTISAVLNPAAVLGNYTITYNTASFTIDKALASVTPNAASKTYGTADPGFSGTLSGFVAADGVTAVYSRTAGETVGAYVISAMLSPTSVLGNYDITSNTAAFDISKKPASVTPAAANKVYGAADPSLTGTLSGFLVADNMTASYSRTAGETVGAYVISAVLSPASALGNYDLTYNTAAFGINRKTASVTPDAASKTYGAADPVLTGTLEGFIAGDSVAASYSRTTGETVGAYVISAVLSPASVLENYDITSNTAAFDINKRTASVTANAANKTYGTADPALSGTLSGFLSADSVSAAYSRTTGETVVGNPYTISAVLSPAGVLENYAITYHTADFTIAARALTVTAAGTSRVYDGTTSATVTLSDDRVAGDVLHIGYTSASFTNKNVGTAKTVSVSGISVTGEAAGNYTFNTTASASADISARLITVTTVASSKIYDGTTASSGVPTISSGTLASGDTLGFTQTYDNKNVGTAKTLTPAGVVSDGNGGSNYAVTLATNTAGIITARPLTVTASGIDKVYDGTTTATVTLSDNRIAGDAFTAIYSSANFSNKNVGANKTVTVSGVAISGAEAGNYALSSTTASTTASITTRPLTVTAVTDSKIYDGTVASSKVPLISGGTSLAGGDTAALAEAFDTPHVGTGKTLKPTALVNDGYGGNNYAVTLVNDVTGVIGAWSLKGFYQPVAMSSGAIVYNTIKGGSTVPLKFNIYAGVGGAEQTTTSAVQSFVLQLISCTPGIDDPVDESFTTTGGTALRYDSTAGQFIQNWQSPKVAGKCYAVTMTAQDSSTVTAYFKTK